MDLRFCCVCNNERCFIPILRSSTCAHRRSNTQQSHQNACTAAYFLGLRLRLVQMSEPTPHSINRGHMDA